jgi:ABC-type transport system substrate-binding protein
MSAVKRTATVAAAGALLLSMGLSGAAAARGHTTRANGVFSNKPTYGGTLTVAWVNATATLDPAYWDDGQSMVSMQSIYDTLVEYDKNSSKLGPGLATHWTISKNGLTYTFFLRNAKFSNGQPVTAQDVAWNMARVSQPGAGSPYSGFALGDVKGFSTLANEPKTSRAYTAWSSNPIPLSGVKVINSHELSITLVKPESYFLNDLALFVCGVADPSVVKKYGPTDKNDQYENHAVGSGPFKLQSWNHNKSMVMVRNPYYWGPKPYLAKVVQLMNVNQQTNYEMFVRGQVQIDGANQLTKATYLEAMSNPKIKKDYHQEPMNWVTYGYLDTVKAPFNNIKVRQALNYGFSKRGMIKVVYGGLAYLPNDGVLPPGMPGWVNSKEPYPYNPTKAKKLLAEAGYGPKHPLSFPYYVPNDQQDRSLAQYLQEQWAAIGVHISIHPVSTSVYWTNGSPPPTGGPQKSYDAGNAGWIQDYPDPSDFFSNLLTGAGNPNPAKDLYAGSNESNYDNPTVDRLVNKATSLPVSQEAERYKLYDQAQKIVEQQAPWLFMAFMVQNALISPKVGPSDINLYLHPIKTYQFQYMWVSK